MSIIALGQQAAVFHQRATDPPFLHRDRRYALCPGLSSARKAIVASAKLIPRSNAALSFDAATFRWNTNSSHRIACERLRQRNTVRSISPQSSSNEEISKEEEGEGGSSQSSREKVELLFTCNQCSAQSRKKVNVLSLQRGTVFLQVMQRVQSFSKLFLFSNFILSLFRDRNLV